LRLREALRLQFCGTPRASAPRTLALSRLSACIVSRIRALKLALAFGIRHGPWNNQHPFINIVATPRGINAIVAITWIKRASAIKPRPKQLAAG
jgi:hypothetical protein